MEENIQNMAVRLNEEHYTKLDAIVTAHQKLIGEPAIVDRSKVIRQLIRLEYDRMISTGVIIAEFPAPEGGTSPVLAGVTK